MSTAASASMHAVHDSCDAARNVCTGQGRPRSYRWIDRVGGFDDVHDATTGGYEEYCYACGETYELARSGPDDLILPSEYTPPGYAVHCRECGAGDDPDVTWAS
ncbi:hypothetical protein [Nocardioides sp.]|uniref:hypothetical protein n=1 Tax=Nocardioides sp. TaxID=35761 RepID=UPI00261FBB4B|nr:hypothetical protein [Nocardioides sp.]